MVKFNESAYKLSIDSFSISIVIIEKIQIYCLGKNYSVFKPTAKFQPLPICKSLLLLALNYRLLP